MTVRVDRRALILSTLEETLSSMDVTLSNGKIAAGNFVHNRDQLSAEKLPGIILLDGDEKGFGQPLPMGRVPPVPMSTRLVIMQPEIYVVLDYRKPQNKSVGDDLTIARQAIVNAVMNEPIMKQICGSNGRIDYEGCVTDLARNRMMHGQMGISFSFIYPWIPLELVSE
jgi:hypothetical protein